MRFVRTQFFRDVMTLRPWGRHQLPLKWFRLHRKQRKIRLSNGLDLVQGSSISFKVTDSAYHGGYLRRFPFARYRSLKTLSMQSLLQLPGYRCAMWRGLVFGHE